MDLLADDFALSPAALALLAAYDAAVKEAAKERAAQAAADDAAAADNATAADEAAELDAEDDADEEESDAPARRTPIAVPRLAPQTVGEADGAEVDEDGDAADLHGLLLAAGALDVDLSNVAAGVRYRVTRSGRGMLAKAA
ncbi:hypothetical protein [Alienimonas sp. DA493]|uniref:hypothetical protein n=1 Tax=Alienimonas sp. DA493 TaxID=3373605 RepID=UPI0037543284